MPLCFRWFHGNECYNIRYFASNTLLSTEIFHYLGGFIELAKAIALKEEVSMTIEASIYLVLVEVDSNIVDIVDRC